MEVGASSGDGKGVDDKRLGPRPEAPEKRQGGGLQQGSRNSGGAEADAERLSETCSGGIGDVSESDHGSPRCADSGGQSDNAARAEQRDALPAQEQGD